MRTQIYTNKEQSSRLLEAGVRPEMADCYMHRIMETDDWAEENFQGQIIKSWMDKSGLLNKDSFYPTWSMSGLIEIMPHRIILMKGCNPYELSIYPSNCVAYDRIGEYSRTLETAIAFYGKDLFTQIIEMIEWLIKEGHFDKKYLMEKGGDK